MRGLALVIVSLALSVQATAADGVREINQAFANAGGPAGDPPGFPVVIGEPGSYRLTGNLVVPDGNTTAILITAEGVSLDLGGFEIRGPNLCGGSPLSCTSSGTGFGVDALVPNVRVSNGSVRGVGSSGIRIGERGEVTDMLLAHNGGGFNGGNGIEAGDHCLLADVTAERNFVTGIFAGDGCRIESCVVRENGFGGILAGLSSTVGGSVAFGNSAFGIYGNRGALLFDDLAVANGGSGLVVEGLGEVRASLATQNARCGISVGSGSHVVGVVAVANTVSPLHFTAAGLDSGIERSLLSHNSFSHSISTSTGAIPMDMGQNYCTTSTGCTSTPLVTGLCP